MAEQAGARAGDVIAFGHTHKPWQKTIGGIHFVSAITKLGSERVISQMKPGVFLDGFFGLTIFSEEVIPGRNEIKNVFIYDRRDEEHPLVITSKAGILKVDTKNPALITLRLTDGSIYVEKDRASGVQGTWRDH